jgi:hypothetical protein
LWSANGDYPKGAKLTGSINIRRLENNRFFRMAKVEMKETAGRGYTAKRKPWPALLGEAGISKRVPFSRKAGRRSISNSRGCVLKDQVEA